MSLSDRYVGDHLRVKGCPDPHRALVYGAGTIFDLDLRPLRYAYGLVGNVGRFGDSIMVKLEGQSYVVDLGRKTVVMFPHARRGTVAGLDTGDTVRLYGVEHIRLREVATTTRIQVLSQRPAPPHVGHHPGG